MKITAKGQVTIPIAIRDQAGLSPDTEVEFELSEQGVLIKKAHRPGGRVTKIISNMKGRATVSMSTEEIMALTRG